MFLRGDSTAWACGYNAHGELGDGTKISRNHPVQVQGLHGIVAIAAGGYHSAFLKSDSTVKTVGFNDKGQLDDNTTWDKHLPVQITGTCLEHSPASSVEDLSSNGFSLYPNPGYGRYEINNPLQEDASLFISDLQGRTVFSQTLQGRKKLHLILIISMPACILTK